MTDTFRLSDQQFQIFQAVHRLGAASARQIQQDLTHLNLAHTTIATVMSRLEKRGLLQSEVSNRERVYRCLVDEDAIRQSMVASLVATVFRGDSKALMAHLVHEGEIDAGELDDLRQLVEDGKEEDQQKKPMKRSRK